MEGFCIQEAFEKRPKGSEGMRQVYKWGKAFLDERKPECKGTLSMIKEQHGVKTQETTAGMVTRRKGGKG